MAELILGPILRYVSATEATIWVETDRNEGGGLWAFSRRLGASRRVVLDGR